MSIEKAIEHLEIVKNFIELEDKSNALHFIKLAMFKLEKQKERIAELEEEKADCFIALNEGKPDITGGCNLVEQIKKLIEKNKQYIDRIAELEKWFDELIFYLEYIEANHEPRTAREWIDRLQTLKGGD